MEQYLPNKYKEQLYKMELFEVTEFRTSKSSLDLIVTRVPGGWLMQYTFKAPTFVPFNNEFQKPSAYRTELGGGVDV